MVVPILLLKPEPWDSRLIYSETEVSLVVLDWGPGFWSPAIPNLRRLSWMSRGRMLTGISNKNMAAEKVVCVCDVYCFFSFLAFG